MLEHHIDSNMHPAEHKAISNLLQIDQQITETNHWEQHRVSPVKLPRKIFSPRKLQCQKPINNQNNFANEKSQQSFKHQQSSEHSPIQSNPENTLRISGVLQKHVAQFNEIQYWNTKVNWMSPTERRAQLSHPKLSKKLSWQEVNGKKGGHLFRYCQEDRNRHEEYRTNLIYSLLQQQNDGWQRGRNESSSTSSLRRNSMEMARVRQVKQQKDQYLSRTNKGLQQNMRQTLRKMYLRNHGDDLVNSSSAAKPSEHERSSMVRELLINIQSMKDVQDNYKPSNEKSKRKVEPTPKSSVDQSSSKKLGKVINMNAEAEKVYCKARIVNRWNGKKPLPINVQ